VRPGLGSAVTAAVPVMPAIRELLLRIDGEYREMPGLNLTLTQAARLWGVDHSTCKVALIALTERGVLRQTAHGTYVRRDT
jgi:DNA-binding IclR family transcriptional regulator